MNRLIESVGVYTLEQLRAAHDAIPESTCGYFFYIAPNGELCIEWESSWADTYMVLARSWFSTEQIEVYKRMLRAAKVHYNAHGLYGAQMKEFIARGMGAKIGK